MVALGVLERGVTEPKAVSAACAKGFVSGMRAGVGIPCALAITSSSCGRGGERAGREKDKLINVYKNKFMRQLHYMTDMHTYINTTQHTRH